MNAAAARAQVKDRRAALDPAQRLQWSQAILRGLQRHPKGWAGRKVGLYRALAGEPELSLVEDWLLQQGSETFHPRVEDRTGGRMEFVQADSRKTELWRAGSFGILEPVAELPAVEPEVLDLILVPGVAFGPGGERIGRGVGYYDRYLVRATRAFRVALAFEFQMFDNLEQNPWDQRVHWIITERREIGRQGAVFPS